MSGYGLAFYTDYVFKHGSDNSFAYNAIVFGADSQEDNNMLVIGQGNIKVPYKSNISATKVKNVLSIHYNKTKELCFY